jgi:hypothetical protein
MVDQVMRAMGAMCFEQRKLSFRWILVALLLSISRVHAQTEWLGYYQWTTTLFVAENATESGYQAIDHPAIEQGKIFPGEQAAYSFRIFQRSFEAERTFFIHGVMGQGNEFVASLSKLNDEGNVTVTREVFVTEYACRGKENCNEISEEAIAFQSVVLDIFPSIDSISLIGDTLSLDGPWGRFGGLRADDPLQLER